MEAVCLGFQVTTIAQFTHLWMDDKGTHVPGCGKARVKECWAQDVACVHGLVNGNCGDRTGRCELRTYLRGFCVPLCQPCRLLEARFWICKVGLCFPVCPLHRTAA